MAPLVGAAALVPCLDGRERPYRDLDCAASTPALGVVADAVADFLPWYSSVHRGAGYKSRRATAAYEAARDSVHRFARRPADGDDVVVLVRNTTEAINHLAYRLRLEPDDVVVSTVVEHHANLLPWARVAQRRWVECGVDGTFNTEDVVAVLDAGRPPALLALTGASNVTGWLPPVEEICHVAHARGVPVLLDAAQLAPHRPLPAGPDFVAFSGHKLYAPYGAGALIGPRRTFETGDPFLAGGGAVDLVDLDEVAWTDPPEREEAGSPNVIGAVAFGAAMDELGRLGWDAIGAHEAALAGATPRRAARHRRGARCWARAPRSTPCRWLPSPWRACIMRWWLPGSAPSSASGCATAASAPTPTCCACSASDPKGWPPPAPRCNGANAVRSPARSGLAVVSGPRARTSTRCWRRCRRWRPGRRHRCPTAKIR